MKKYSQFISEQASQATDVESRITQAIKHELSASNAYRQLSYCVSWTVDSVGADSFTATSEEGTREFDSLKGMRAERVSCMIDPETDGPVDESDAVKYTPDTARECPDKMLEVIYDKDDNVLFGSRTIKGKVTYRYVPGSLMQSGRPFIIGSRIAYDGVGNKDLPKGAVVKDFSELPEMFPDNEFA